MARTPDLSRRYLGTACHLGHDGWRYRKGGGCVKCAYIRRLDQRALAQDALPQLRQRRRDTFKEMLALSRDHLYQAGEYLQAAKDAVGRGGWRDALREHGLSQRVAAELRRYFLRESQRRTAPDWLQDK